VLAVPIRRNFVSSSQKNFETNYDTPHTSVIRRGGFVAASLCVQHTVVDGDRIQKGETMVHLKRENSMRFL
jgi:hypothetical protein